MKWKDKSKFLKAQNLFSLIFLLLFLGASLFKEPWHDELYTKEVIKKSPFEIINEIKKDNYPPFYYLLLHYLTLPFKHSIFSIRFFSSIFIFLSGFILMKIIKPKNFFWFLIIFFPVPFYFGIEARCYSLIILLSSLYFYEIFNKERPFFIFLYLTLLSYTHYLSISFLTYLIFFILFGGKKKYTSSLILSILAYIPLYFLFSIQPKESILWAGQFINLKSIIYFFSNLGPNLFENYIYNFYPFLPPFIFFIINVSIILYNFKDKILRIIIISFIFNFLEIFLFSFFYKNIYTQSRTESFFFIPFAILFINFLNKENKLIKFLKIFIILITILSLTFMFLSFQKGIQYSQEIEKITNFVKKDTKICIIGYWKLTFQYKLEKRGYENKIITFPVSQDEHQGWYYVKELKEKDIDWFKKNIINSEEPILILWDRQNLLAKKIVEIFPEDKKIISTENFSFILIN